MTASRYLGRLTDQAQAAEHLRSKGFAPLVAAAKAKLLAQAASSLSDQCPDGASVRAYYVPGRIEVLGKHTDYAGGSSMIAAAERGFCLVASGREDSQIVVTDAVWGDTIRFAIHPELAPRAGHWSNYPMTVARRIARNFSGVRRGVDMALASDLPPAAGMSSSSAFMVGVFLALADANDVWQHPDFPAELHQPLNLAGYLGTVENGQSYGALEGDRGVGTFGGSEDHTAILCSRADHLAQYAYCPVRFEKRIALPAGYTFAIASSGVAAEKTGEAQEKYNQASRLATAIAELWRRQTGRDDRHLAAALHSSSSAAQQLSELIASAAPAPFDRNALSARLQHFIVENEQVIPAAGDALARGDLDEFGRRVDQSQQSAERLLQNQIPETCYLANAARQRGAPAASAFGAGFGGSVWAMIENERIEDFLNAWGDAYRKQFPQHAGRAEFFSTAAGPAAFRLV